MSIAVLQSKTAVTSANAASLSAVFDTPPTEGNLLVAIADASASMTMTSSGWLLATSNLDFVFLGLWTKIAGAAESDTVTVTPSSSIGVALVIAELTGGIRTGVVDATASQTTAGNASAIASGTTGATAQADEFAIAAFGCNRANGVRTFSGYTNGFTELADISGVATTAAQSAHLAVATKTLDTIGAVTTTATISGSAQHPQGLIVTFRAASPVGIQVRLSGGSANADRTLSIGGAKSSVEADTSLFDDVTPEEATAGETEYRCVYMHNPSGSLSVDVIAYIAEQPEDADLTVQVGAATESAGSTVSAIADSVTAPAGVSFDDPSTPETGVDLGTIGPGQGKGLWIARTAAAGTTFGISDTARIMWAETPS